MPKVIMLTMSSASTAPIRRRMMYVSTLAGCGRRLLPGPRGPTGAGGRRLHLPHCVVRLLQAHGDVVVLAERLVDEDVRGVGAAQRDLLGPDARQDHRLLHH